MDKTAKQPSYIEGKGWRHATEPSHSRRHPTHNYGGVGTYLVTVTTIGRRTLFGSVEGNPRAAPGSAAFPHTVPSPLGAAVLRSAVPQVGERYPMVEIWRCCLMPDHIHLVVRVNAALPGKWRLGNVVGLFKAAILREWRALGGIEERLLEPGFNDRILMRPGQLDCWLRYVTENPLRLVIRRQWRAYMSTALSLTVNGTRYAAFGNFQLLKYPEKLPVFCHRYARYHQLSASERERHGIAPLPPEGVTSVPYETTEAFARERQAWIEAAACGTVLVSPAVSAGELLVKNTCIERGLPFIHLQREAITRLWKPERTRFYACQRGTLLIMSPWRDDLPGESAWEQFHNMNTLAARICDTPTATMSASVRQQ